MNKKSSGILLYRVKKDLLQFLLVHPGGPFWKNKDEAAWTIPKGEFSVEEDPLDAAKREFREETGFSVPEKFIELTPLKQKSGKIVHCWAAEGDVDPGKIRSNTFELEWPPRSGNEQEFPEVDKAGWFSADEAKHKINPAQYGFIEELIGLLSKK